MDPITTATIAIVSALSSAGIFAGIGRYINNRQEDKKQEIKDWMHRYDVMFEERTREYNRLVEENKENSKLITILETKYDLLKQELEEARKTNRAERQRLIVEIDRLKIDLSKEREYNKKLKNDLENVKQAGIVTSNSVTTLSNTIQPIQPTE